MRESNAHLRRENEELSKRVSTSNEQLKAMKDTAAPLEEAMRKLRAEKEGLEGTNGQLLVDANYWRDRCVGVCVCVCQTVCIAVCMSGCVCVVSVCLCVCLSVQPLTDCYYAITDSTNRHLATTM